MGRVPGLEGVPGAPRFKEEGKVCIEPLIYFEGELEAKGE